MKFTVIFLALLFVVSSVFGAAAFGMGASKSNGSERNFRKSVKKITGTFTKDKKFMYGPGDYERGIRVDLRKRYYELHVPSSYDKTKPVPVVLLFHGGGSDPGAVRYESGMDTTADKNGFIVVYPGGANKRLLLKNRLLLWNDGRPYQDGSFSKVDDIEFVERLLDDVGMIFRIDSKRIYACGYSNGAQFTYRLAKRLTGRIAAIATVAGHRPVKDEFDPLPSKPVSVMQFSGTKDKLGPYYGGSPPEAAGLKTTLKPVNETIKSWVEFNQCPGKPEEKRTGKAVMKRYGPCKDDTEVILWTLEGGGHTWPGGKIVPNVQMLGLGNLGNVNRDINASDLMWDFFKRHSLK